MNHFLKIPKPAQGRRFVIADIHGCYQTFRYLVLEKISLEKNDQLFLLGDYIDRGPDSAKVLDFIMQLQEKGFQVFPLRGNHEDDMLGDWQFYKNLQTVKNYETFIERQFLNNSQTLLNDRGALKDKYFYFLQDLPYYYELDDYYLVHAGFNMNAPDPFIDYENMLWIRTFIHKKRKMNKLNGKKVVVGHTVQLLSFIQERIAQDHVVIPLDNACYYGYKYKNDPDIRDLSKFGNLCALNLDSMELYVQPNID